MTPLMQTVYRPARRITTSMIAAIFLVGFACGLLAACWIAAAQHATRIEMEARP